MEAAVENESSTDPPNSNRYVWCFHCICPCQCRSAFFEPLSCFAAQSPVALSGPLADEAAPEHLWWPQRITMRFQASREELEEKCLLRPWRRISSGLQCAQRRLPCKSAFKTNPSELVSLACDCYQICEACFRSTSVKFKSSFSLTAPKAYS